MLRSCKPSHFGVSGSWKGSWITQSQASEDYWADASVSLKCFDSLDVFMKEGVECSRKPEVVRPHLPAEDTDGTGKSSCKDKDEHIEGRDKNRGDACASSQEEYWTRKEEEAEVIVEAGPPTRNRNFPPPIASSAMRSIRKDGRLVLKEVNACPQGFFRAQRENGRLRLQLIESDHEYAEADPVGKAMVEDKPSELTRKETVILQFDEEEPRKLSIWKRERVNGHSEKLQSFSIGAEARNRGPETGPAVVETTSRACQDDRAQREEPVDLIASSPRIEISKSIENDNGFMSCNRDCMQAEGSVGSGGQAARQQQPQWKTRMGSEGTLKLCPPTQFFLHQSLTPVVAS